MVDDDRIYGRGLVNMKAAFPCYIEAVSAMQKAGVKLKGDLIIAGVVGEIEKAQIGRFQGKTYRGAGVGARYLMDHGVMADMCIIGEPTGLQLQIGNSGLLWARVSVDGKATKFVLAACKVAQAIQDWEKEYQRKNPHKFMLPTVQIGAIDGGNRVQARHPADDGHLCHRQDAARRRAAGDQARHRSSLREGAQTGERYSRHSRRSLSDHARL